jgi:uncharacterized protein (TIGR03382 family)
LSLAVLLLCAPSAALAQATLLFDEVIDAFDPQACGGDGCYTNYLRLTDVDGDADLDVLIPNSGAGDEPFVVYENDGFGVFTSVSQTVFEGGVYLGHLRQIAVGDIDADGDKDIYGPDATGEADVLFVNDGTGYFVDEQVLRMPAGLGSNAAAARFGDADNDGDLDLFLGDRFSGNGTRAAHLYVNDGGGFFTDATNQLPATTDGDVAYDFDLFDMDRDWDLDLLIDMHVGTSMLWANDGTGTYVQAPFPAQGALKYGPVACDVDGDTDLDLWFDNAGPGYSEELLINDGTGTFVDETSERVAGNNGADDNGLVCLDVDGDGDLDAAIASLSDEERVLINDGSGLFTLQPGAFSEANDPTLWFDFGDVNGDGRLDAVTGQGEGGNFEERLYFGTTNVAVDTVAPKIVAVEPAPETVQLDVSPVVRFAVSDNTTTDEGPRLSRAFARVTVGTVESEIEAVFSGGDIFRLALPAEAVPTHVTFLVCATDRRGFEACSELDSYDVVGTEPPPPDDTGLPAPEDTDDDLPDVPPPEDDGGSDGGCNCATGATPATPWLAWLGAAAWLRRRRRS